MEWISESRRKRFESSVGPQGFVRNLDRLLPEMIKTRALPVGDEIILPYEDAVSAIAIASEHQIAILGFDAGEITEQGFQSLNYSGYDRNIELIGDWSSYVSMMNSQAERWIKEHPLPENHGYILTSASEDELREAKKQLK